MAAAANTPTGGGPDTSLPGHSLLRRPHLEARLDEAFGKRVTTVVAGAGFGKTTLLRSWTSDIYAVWYTLGQRDTSVPTLARGLTHALTQVVEQPLDEDAVPLDVPSAPDESRLGAEAFAGYLSDRLEQVLVHDLVLVLDDLHELSPGSPSARLVENLCRQTPARLHVVLASRLEIPFRIDRLRGRGDVNELTASDLAFDATEIAALVPAEDRELAETLYEVSAGWPALARVGLEALGRAPGPQRSAVLERLRRPGGALFSYLANEVLAHEPPEVVELVGTVARLERFTAELCVALGFDDAPAMIEALQTRGLFLEHRGDAFALHGLVREVALRAWPMAADDVRSLHGRAAEWYAQRSELPEALASLAGAGDHAGMARLLRERGDEALSAGAADHVIERAGSLPHDLRDSSIEQIVGQAHAVRGEFDAALACFNRAAGDRERLPSGLAWRMLEAYYFRDELDEALTVAARAEPDEGSRSDRALLLAWHAAAQRRRGDAPAARELADEALEAARASQDLGALAAAHTSVALAAPGFRHRDAELGRALQAAQSAGDLLQEARIRNNRGSNLVEEGRYAEALVELDAAIRLAELGGFAGLSALAEMNTGLAYWCLGRLDEASSAYAAALTRYRQTGSGEASYALIGLGDVHRERGDLALARAAYEEGLALAEAAGDLQGVVPGLYQLAKVLVDDDPERATSLAERAVAHGWPDPAWALNAAGWVALVRGDRKRAAEAAREAEAVAREQRDGFGLAEALELRALTTDDTGAARMLLEDALAAWREVGNSIHEATVQLGLARLSARPDAQAAAARAERRLRRLGVRVSPTGAAGLLRVVSSREGPHVAVQALGGFAVLRDGQPVAVAEWRSKKARDLFQILVSRRGRPVQRELVMEALWPGEDAAKLGNRLSVALSTLRGVLDPERRFDAERFVAGDRQTLALRTDAVAVDVEAFFAEANAGLAAHAAGHTPEAADLLASAEAAYAGDFLEEVYDDWAVVLREDARSLYVDVARALAEIAGAAGELDEAARYLLRILSRDGHDERAHLDLVRALARAGRHGEARRQYRRYASRMEEIGVEPAPYPATTRAVTTALRV